MRVLVAMSGGVDSSMAAAILVEDGHEVTGVHLKMADTPSGLPGKGCCTLDDARDARRVADRLGIPFYVWDLTEAFRERVVDDFVASYAAGQTPNPCIRCNERVKYTALLAKARAAGFDALATGHHVRVRLDRGRWRLLRATDPAKDQTYVLYMATQGQLVHTLMPAGEHTKADLRAMAAERGLLTASKPDSHDICFIPSGDLGRFLSGRLGSRRGTVVGPDGEVLAEHDGAYRFTIGQRRGLGLAGQRQALYVTAIESSTVHVGPIADLDVTAVETGAVSWVAGEPPPAGLQVGAQVRYRGRPLDALVTSLPPDRPEPGVCRSEPRSAARTDTPRVRVEFITERPAGVAPGQSVVFYAGEECLGGGVITRAVAPAPAHV